MSHDFVYRSLFKRSAKEVLGWHLRPSSLHRAIPPWECVRFSEFSARPDKKGQMFCEQTFGPFTLRALFRYDDYVDKEMFTLVQQKGFFSHFKLKSQVRSLGGETCELVEKLSYQFPLGFVDRLYQKRFKKRLERIFSYKHEVIAKDLETFECYPFEKPLGIAVSGASGFVGSALVSFLECAGHQVFKMVRGPTRIEKEIYWDHEKGEIEKEKLEGLDAVIHLAGENIAAGRWSEERKRRLLSSRSDATAFLAKALGELKAPPKTFLSASAVGYYGDRGRERLSEESCPGSSFLNEICERWEQASQGLEMRRVLLRFGMILSSEGGALKKMLPIFKCGLGGRLGDGKQFVSWVAIDDVLGAIYHALMREDVSGPINVTAPTPVTNQEFSEELARALGPWMGPPVPAWALRTLYGEMADSLFLTSTRAFPEKLQKSGYQFRYPSLRAALTHLV